MAFITCNTLISWAFITWPMKCLNIGFLFSCLLDITYFIMFHACKSLANLLSIYYSSTSNLFSHAIFFLWQYIVNYPNFKKGCRKGVVIVERRVNEEPLVLPEVCFHGKMCASITCVDETIFIIFLSTTFYIVYFKKIRQIEQLVSRKEHRKYASSTFVHKHWFAIHENGTTVFFEEVRIWSFFKAFTKFVDFYSTSRSGSLLVYPLNIV